MNPEELEPVRRLRLKSILLTGVIIVVLFAWAQTIRIPQRESPQSQIQILTVKVESPPQVIDYERETELPQRSVKEVDKVDSEVDPVEDAVGLGSSSAQSGETAAFLGIRESTRRVVIAFDVAESVRMKAQNAGVPLERIRDEASRLVHSLDERSSFVLLQFVRRYQQFPAEMLPASGSLRADALDWLHEYFRTDGRSGANWIGGEPDGIELVLDRALRLQPEVVFLISDGDFQRTRTGSRRGWENVSWAALEEQVARWQIRTGRRLRIHVIGIQMEPDHQKLARRFVARFGGQLRLID